MISGDEIRILDLLPHADRDAPIICDIRSASLSGSPEYEVLSYTWGDAEHLENVKVAGKEVGITMNLLAALRRLRWADKPRSLWIDQLCINQWDTAEKAQQVRLMRKIYSESQRCVIWMGELREDVPQVNAEAALEILKWMAKMAEVEQEDVESVPRPACVESKEAFQGPMAALRALSAKENPWWTRVWTVQEVVLPKQQHMLWGPLSMPWDTMIGASRALVSRYIEALLSLLTLSQGNTVNSLMAMIIWLEVARDRNESPLYMVTRWRWRQATDLRDKIFALLGLCSAGTLPMVERCGYDMPVVEVYCTLTIDLIMNEQTLKPLVKDPRVEDDRATAGIPRWAMDLGSEAKFETDWYHMYGYHYYNAHAGWQLDLQQLRQRAQETKDTLQLRGTRADTIKWVAEPLYKPSPEDPEADQIFITGIRGWQTFAQKHVSTGTPDSPTLYPGHYTLRAAFARTMLGDLIRNGEQWTERWAAIKDVDKFYRYLETGEMNDIRMTTDGMTRNQRFFVTETGLMGLGHLETKVGDEVWVFEGGHVPFTIRKRGEDDGHNGRDYGFVGRCYVQGIMQGEVFHASPIDGKKHIKNIVLY